MDDLIDGIIKMMALNNDFTGPVNIGNPHEISIKQLAETILDLTKSKSKIVYKNLPIDDPKRRKPDITLAKDILNWKPKKKLALGLKETIAYFKKNLNFR